MPSELTVVCPDKSEKRSVHHVIQLRKKHIRSQKTCFELVIKMSIRYLVHRRHCELFHCPILQSTPLYYSVQCQAMVNVYKYKYSHRPALCNLDVSNVPLTMMFGVFINRSVAYSIVSYREAAKSSVCQNKAAQRLS